MPNPNAPQINPNQVITQNQEIAPTQNKEAQVMRETEQAFTHAAPVASTPTADDNVAVVEKPVQTYATPSNVPPAPIEATEDAKSVEMWQKHIVGVFAVNEGDPAKQKAEFDRLHEEYKMKRFNVVKEA